MRIKTSAAYKKKRKKLSKKDLVLVDEVVTKLATGCPLEAKFKDHALRGKYQGTRATSARTCFSFIKSVRRSWSLIELGSHAELF